MKPFILAVSTLIGTIIGAGIFGVSYAFLQSGAVVGVVLFGVLGALVLFLHLAFGEVCLRTNQTRRLVGYAEQYLGNTGKVVAIATTFFGVFGALLAYMILAGSFLSLIFGDSLSSFQYSLLFWGVLGIVVVRGIKTISFFEVFLSILLVIVGVGIGLVVAPHMELSRIPLGLGPNPFLLFGILIFAFAGWSAVPEIAELMKGKRDKRRLDNVLVTGSIVTGIVYFIFALLVVGVTGGSTSPDALTSLVPVLGNRIAVLGALFGLAAIAGSYMVLGSYVKHTIHYDLKIPVPVAGALTLAVPLALFLVGVRGFIEVLGIVGLVMGSVEGVLILLVFLAARKKGERTPEYRIHVSALVVWGAMGLLILGGVLAVLSL